MRDSSRGKLLVAPLSVCRIGFSLIEVVVVIAIIGALVALIMGAVQRVRATAARVECADKLRQAGLALHGYHNSHGWFPPGVSSNDEKDPLLFMSWCTRTLPYLEQSQLWEAALAAFAVDRNFLNVPPHNGLATPLAAFS